MTLKGKFLRSQIVVRECYEEKLAKKCTFRLIPPYDRLHGPKMLLSTAVTRSLCPYAVSA
jgi:hypothetical protein